MDEPSTMNDKSVVKLLCFSATGNSLWVTRQLAGRLDSAEIIRIRKAAPMEVAGTIGIVMPVHAWGVPIEVARQIAELSIAPDSYCFAIATFGMLAGGTIGQLARLLQKQGATLAAGFVIRMPEIFTAVLPVPPPPARKKMYQAAEERIIAIADIVKKRSARPLESSWFLPNLLFTRILNRLSAPNFHKLGSIFKVGNECTGCRRCERMCHAGTIEMKEGKPVWGEACTQCYACLHWCPTKAISIGLSNRYEQYHHPEISHDDIVGGSDVTGRQP